MFLGKTDLKVEQMYDEYGKMILNIAYHIVQNHHAAEDITQETIEKIIRNPERISQIEGNSRRNYIARIAANTSYDFVKKNNSSNLVPLEEVIDLSDDFDIEELMISEDTKERLKNEIRMLDAKYRDPLTLHKLDGHTVAEVSDLIGVPERTVKERIRKAMLLLKRALTEGDE